MVESEPVARNIDDYKMMQLRKLFSGLYAERPMNLYEVGFNMIREYCGQLAVSDVVLDVGTNSMLDFVKAARKAGCEATLKGVDPYRDAYDLYMPPERKSMYEFIHAYGERIPLPANSVAAAHYHNVLFRAYDYRQMINEARRVVMPGGLIVVSSNGSEHAAYRHGLSQSLGMLVADTMLEEGASRMKFKWTQTPARDFYAENARSLFSPWTDLVFVNEVAHISSTVINRDRLDDWIQNIKNDFDATNLPEGWRTVWQALAESFTLAKCKKRMRETQKELKEYRQFWASKGLPEGRSPIQPVFFDMIDRRVSVFQNQKPDDFGPADIRQLAA